MSNDKKFVVGMILESPLRQFTKIISFSKGRFALSGWTSREHAEKATVPQIYLNIYGIQQANLRIVSGSSKKDKAQAPASSAGSTTGNKSKKPTKADLKKLSAKEVKALAEKLGVDASGNRPEVEERILSL